MEKNKDILTSSPELKTMPYYIPDGYMDQFKNEAKVISISRRRSQEGFIEKLSPLITMAAMFLAIVKVGNLVMKNSGEEETLTYEDYIVHSDTNISEVNSDIDNTQIAQAQVTAEDIVQYLIYIGEPTESLEENYQD